MNYTKDKQFKIIIEQDEDGYFFASVPALPGCHTQAKTLTDLNKRIKEAISLCMEVAQTNSKYQECINFFASEPIFIGLETIRV